jgi:hypothetical protein
LNQVTGVDEGLLSRVLGHLEVAENRDAASA